MSILHCRPSARWMPPTRFCIEVGVGPTWGGGTRTARCSSLRCRRPATTGFARLSHSSGGPRSRRHIAGLARRWAGYSVAAQQIIDRAVPEEIEFVCGTLARRDGFVLNEPDTADQLVRALQNLSKDVAARMTVELARSATVALSEQTSDEVDPDSSRYSVHRDESRCHRQQQVGDHRAR